MSDLCLSFPGARMTWHQPLLLKDGAQGFHVLGECSTSSSPALPPVVQSFYRDMKSWAWVRHDS